MAVVARSVEQDLLDNPRVQALCQALAACADDSDLMLRFLRDVLSYRELRDAANRWAVAQLLLESKSEAEVASRLAISLKTVSKIYQWVHGPFGTGGFADAHQCLAQGHAHVD